MKTLRKLVLRLPLVGWLLQQRFVKFGSVGFSGTLVNLGVLYVGQEYLFRAIEPEGMRLDLSLVLAIFCATVNNFTWNRIWTWADRKEEVEKHFVIQLGQYFVACWLAIIFQFFFTKILAVYMFYMVANITAIVMASVINYVMNDIWTFASRKARLRSDKACATQEVL
jgi:putative flippase GtrA